MKIGVNTLVSAVFPFYSYKKKAEMSGEQQRYFTPARIYTNIGGNCTSIVFKSILWHKVVKFCNFNSNVKILI